jgi:hypothetical protein
LALPMENYTAMTKEKVLLFSLRKSESCTIVWCFFCTVRSEKDDSIYLHNLWKGVCVCVCMCVC